MKKVIGIGNALTDVLIQIEDYQLSQFGIAKGSMEYVDAAKSAHIRQVFSSQKQQMVAGGSVSNTIKAISMLGGKSAFLGSVGGDEIGRFYAESIRNKGVTSHLKVSAEPSGNCTVLITPDGERTMCTNLGASIRLSSADLTPALLSQYDIFHTEGYLVSNRELIYDCMQRAKLAGLLVSIDLASFNIVEQNYDFLHDLVERYVDVVFANEDEARAYTRLEPEEALREMARYADYAVVKLGSRGSLIAHAGKTYRIEATASRSVDTTGAGDFYAAGFLYGLACGYDIQRCGNLGALVSGRVVEVIGPNLSSETWAEIRRSELV